MVVRVNSFVFSAVVILVYLSLLSLNVHAGKDKDVRKRPPTRTSGSAADAPDLQTVSQWQKHSLEVLRLACEQAHLVSTGSRNVLARRLYDHRHRSASSSHQTILLPPPSNSIDLVSSPPLSINNVVNSSTPPSLVPSIDFQNILRDEFQKFLSINMLSPPPSSNLLPTHSALQHSAPVAGNISHEAFQINQGAAAVPQASSSFPPAPVIAAANHLSLPESLFNNLMQPSPTTVLSPTSTSSSLPPLPRNILDQIQAGKFVKLDDLLPAVSPLNTDEYSIKINSASGGDPSISLVQNRPRVVDFHTWLTAWNFYLQAMAFYHPTQVTDLIHYQSVFTRFASQYTFSVCFAYHRLFRHAMANNPTLSWARVDDDLFNRYLRGAPLRTICFSCHNYGHTGC